jgi:probable HAF family extracellular repeat protein
MQDLGTLGGQYSEANGIDDHGRVVGGSDTASGHDAFLYSNGSMQDLGSIGGSGNSEASAINGHGEVAGWSYVGNTFSYHAFLYRNGSMQDLGSLAGAGGVSQATAINAGSQIVGWSVTDQFGAPQHAFLYSNGTMVDLNTLDTSSPIAGYVTLYRATGINDHGWIVANGVDSRTGATHAYLLVPLASHP